MAGCSGKRYSKGGMAKKYKRGGRASMDTGSRDMSMRAIPDSDPPRTHRQEIIPPAKGGMAKGYKKGGKVKGAGMCKKGVRPCKMR
jgi:hypothetical protein